jgi:F-type H+/Na+-transporting ATPase subunit alpha
LNGYLDDIPTDKVAAFAKGLRDYLKTSKAGYGEIVREKKDLTPEAETMLKEAIAEYKKTFLAAA